MLWIELCTHKIHMLRYLIPKVAERSFCPSLVHIVLGTSDARHKNDKVPKFSTTEKKRQLLNKLREGEFVFSFDYTLDVSPFAEYVQLLRKRTKLKNGIKC